MFLKCLPHAVRVKVSVYSDEYLSCRRKWMFIVHVDAILILSLYSGYDFIKFLYNNEV